MENYALSFWIDLMCENNVYFQYSRWTQFLFLVCKFLPIRRRFVISKFQFCELGFSVLKMEFVICSPFTDWKGYCRCSAIFKGENCL